MSYLKLSKILGVIISIVQLGSTLAMILSMHTLLGVFSTALPRGDQGIEIQFTDPVIIPFSLTPTNNGFIEATMEVSVSMVVDGVEIAFDSDAVVVPSGSIVPVDLELSIPLDDAEAYFQEGSDLQLTTEISVSTLFDLISFNNRAIIEGGIQ